MLFAGGCLRGRRAAGLGGLAGAEASVRIGVDARLVISVGGMPLRSLVIARGDPVAGRGGGRASRCAGGACGRIAEAGIAVGVGLAGHAGILLRLPARSRDVALGSAAIHAGVHAASHAGTRRIDAGATSHPGTHARAHPGADAATQAAADTATNAAAAALRLSRRERERRHQRGEYET